MYFDNITLNVSKWILGYLGVDNLKFSMTKVKSEDPEKVIGRRYRSYFYNRESFWEALQNTEDTKRILDLKKIKNFDELEYSVWNWMDDTMRRIYEEERRKINSMR